ncbi:hypothetical protein BH24ACT26_BH24ACT26_10970 [soil metagenome]
MKDGETLAPESYTKSARLQSRTVDDFIDPGRVLGHFAEGATIVFQALHRHWEPLSRFCRELELTFTHPVQVNVYLTPPSSRGLDVHYDTHDVFVLQVSGTKHWEVYGRALDLPLAHQRRRGKYPNPGVPQIDVELKPGDCLYVPRGFLHGAETNALESTHMTIGILSYTWMDVMKVAMEHASDEVFLRDALPTGFAYSPGDAADAARDKLSAFARWLADLDPEALTSRVAERFWSSRAPVLTGQLQQVLDLDTLGDESLVRRRRGTVWRMRVDPDEVVLVLGDRRVHLPARVAPALQHMFEREELEVIELSEHLDASGRRVLVRRLILEGLFEQVQGG